MSFGILLVVFTKVIFQYIFSYIFTSGFLHSMKNIAYICLPLFLGACAGGGSSGGGSTASTTPFTTFSAIAPNSTVQSTGGSTQFTYTSSAAVSNGQSISGATLTTKYDASTTPTSISIQSAQGASVSINTAIGDTISTSGGVILGASKDTATNIIVSTGFEYQSFGVWAAGAGAGTAGAFSVGSPTAVANIPTSGTASFAGKSFGVYGSAGSVYSTLADMTASVNFTNRSIMFTTANTINNDTKVSVSGLNLIGSFAYNAGSATFSGGVVSISGMSGVGLGQFYGPAANEIGGTVSLSGSNGVFTGSFGGKR